MLEKIRKYYVLLFIKMYRYAPVSVVVTVIGRLVIALTPAITTYILAGFVETVRAYLEKEKEGKSIILWGMLLVGIYIFRQLIEFILSITVNAGIYEKCNSKLKIEIMEKVSGVSLIDFENVQFLNSFYRAQDCVNREIPSSVFDSFLILATNFVGVLSVVIVLAQYNLWFVPISLISVFPFYIVKKIRGKEFYNIKFKQTTNNRKLGYYWGLFSSKESAREMRIFSCGDYLMEKWTNIKDELNEEIWEFNMKEAKSLLFCDTIRIMGYIMSILFSIFLLHIEKIAIGPFSACISAFVNVQNTVSDFFVRFGDLENNGEFLKDLFTFLDYDNSEETKQIFDKSSISYDNKCISFKNVCFKYPNTEKYSVSNLSFDIYKGMKIAIVGENGSGKTTLCKLLLGMYTPEQGEIFSEYDKELIGIVAQNYIKYKLPLRENVAISNIKEAEETEKIIGILKNVKLDDLISAESGIDYQLGTEFGGVDLSGGQWQKIAIARALFSKADLYVLDEPTSALDPMIELETMERFLDIAKRKTTILVLHRLGLCKKVDKIIVMNNGEIVEFGTHEELMKVKGNYYEMYNEQSKWYK